MPLRTKRLSWHTSTSGNKQKPALHGDASHKTPYTCKDQEPRGYQVKQGPSRATHFPGNWEVRLAATVLKI